MWMSDVETLAFEGALAKIKKQIEFAPIYDQMLFEDRFEKDLILRLVYSRQQNTKQYLLSHVIAFKDFGDKIRKTKYSYAKAIDANLLYADFSLYVNTKGEIITTDNIQKDITPVKYSYKYLEEDKNGNWTKKEVYYGNRLIETSKRFIEYY